MLVVYIAIITIANVITSMFQPLILCNGYLVIPLGTFLVGITFFIRDLIQLRVGRSKVYQLVAIATLLSGLVNLTLDNSLSVTLASVVSFFVSEAIDTEVFTRVKGSVTKRIVVSGVFGGTLDSMVFILLGLSPIGSNVLTWNVVPFAIIGQTFVKSFMQFAILPLFKVGER